MDEDDQKRKKISVNSEEIRWPTFNFRILWLPKKFGFNQRNKKNPS